MNTADVQLIIGYFLSIFAPFFVTFAGIYLIFSFVGALLRDE